MHALPEDDTVDQHLERLIIATTRSVGGEKADGIRLPCDQSGNDLLEERAGVLYRHKVVAAARIQATP
jgi:hypothetical protein